MFQLLRGFVLPAAACDGSRDGDSRYANLFKKLDLNEDGRVDIAELQTGLRAMGIPLGKEAEETCWFMFPHQIQRSSEGVGIQHCNMLYIIERLKNKILQYFSLLVAFHIGVALLCRTLKAAVLTKYTAEKEQK